MQASATLKTVQISAFYNKNYILHSRVCFGETTALFQTISACPAALHRVQQLGFLVMLQFDRRNSKIHISS